MPTNAELLDTFIAQGAYSPEHQTAMRATLTDTEPMTLRQLLEHIRDQFYLDLFTRREDNTLHLDAVGKPLFTFGTPLDAGTHGTASCAVAPGDLSVQTMQDTISLLCRTQLIPFLTHWKMGLAGQ